MTGLRFTKITEEVTEDKGAKVDKFSTLPTPENGPSGDSVPGLSAEQQSGRRRRRGMTKQGEDTQAVPLDIAPPNVETVDESPTKNKGGRPKGKGKGKSAPVMSAEALGKQVFGLHQMLNLAIPGTEIPMEKAMMLGEALHDVMEAYDIEVDKRISSLLVLGATVAIVEMPVIQRVRFTMIQKAGERKAVQEQAREQSASVPVGEPMKVETRVERPVVQANTGGVALGEPFKG